MTKKIKKTREEVIDELLDDVIESARADIFFITSVFVEGCKGYKEYTNEELATEWNNNIGESLNERVVIVEAI